MVPGPESSGINHNGEADMCPNGEEMSAGVGTSSVGRDQRSFTINSPGMIMLLWL